MFTFGGMAMSQTKRHAQQPRGIPLLARKPDGQATKPPNILWICTDQQRWDTLGCYVATPSYGTPNSTFRR